MNTELAHMIVFLYYNRSQGWSDKKLFAQYQKQFIANGSTQAMFDKALAIKKSDEFDHQLTIARNHLKAVFPHLEERYL